MRAVACLVAAACLVAGVLLDHAYARSTPGAVETQGTIVDFVRRNSRQVYPVFEFQDLEGKTHRVVNSTQQAVVRFAAGDAVAIAYSRMDPERARIDTLWFDHRWIIAAVIVALTVFGGALRADAARNGR
jgi:translation initiation factor IF-1